MPLFAAAIFLSAFLLFQVQPVIARYILPWYGGSPAVWTTCLLFFQVGLLGGYAYAHGLVSTLRNHRRWQVGIPCGLLAITLLLLPITPDDSLKPTGGDPNPVFDIVRLLALTVGMPYLLLSASGPLLQHWFSDAFPTRSPYRLYAVSNIGSILGLVTYPFLFEPLMAVSQQTAIWSATFVVYAGAALACGIALLRRRHPDAADAATEAAEPAARPPLGNVLLWIAFAACGSLMLLAVTNQMCQDVAVVPFLWVLPLSLYLLTFVISFDHARWYHRAVWVPLALLAVGLLVFLINQQWADTEMHLGWQIAIFMAVIFTGCLICHGEIVRLKPDAHYLTGFYLAISFGGALGGLFASVIAPLIFNAYWELHLVLVMLVALSAFALWRDARHWPSLIARISLIAGIVIASTSLGYGLNRHINETRNGSIDSMRSFYGVLRVYERHVGTDDYFKALYHGRISHGRQYLNPRFRRLATTYFTTEGGMGAASFHIKTRPEQKADNHPPLHFGIVGLGVGTIATYARPGDSVRFYEINPQVEDMARRHFSYLDDCRGKLDVIIGDARTMLERELHDDGPQQFDVLIVDAFSGDSIPIHLLTEEAFDIYFQHLKPDGVLAVHITNLHLDLSDPVRTLSKDAGYEALNVVNYPDKDVYHAYYSHWVLISRDPTMAPKLKEHGYTVPWPREAKAIHWTDDYCNLLDVVRW